MIRLSDIRFRWGTGEPDVLDIAAFNVDRGERVFLQGPSGSGKTTLLNLLGGVALPRQGAISIMGDDIVKLSAQRRDAFRAAHIGFIFQLFNLVPYLGLIENVTLPCRFSPIRRQRIEMRQSTPEQEAHRLLTHMQLDPEKLASRPVSQLSVGQQQRVAAARSLIGAPELIIADEPTSSIDTEARHAFLDLMMGEVARNSATLLMVSHDPGLRDQFDRTVSLADINRAQPDS